MTMTAESGSDIDSEDIAYESDESKSSKEGENTSVVFNFKPFL